ncbi:sarcoglycan alpha isoform X2 [Lycorma delicatula]|uniref:sarcoglycan alpha isoform X2 n=1 Tax=Lycorma delicatula TaxID=130591 RepID=UPI003F519710
MWHLIIYLTLLALSSAEQVYTTKVFIMPVEPRLFDWTRDGPRNQFSFHPSLLDAPDLPSWMYYRYSDRHGAGFLYGVPPSKQKDFQVEIIGLNRQNYETKRHVVNMNVIEKSDIARNEVHMKIDNLNLEDMFDIKSLIKIMDVFRVQLWPDSAEDLYVTFLASAIQLGARLPLTPNEGEGVVLRLGSSADFSHVLLDLQEEVRPLRKMYSCRGFKRTTVERILRKDGFTLDWCAFRLISHNKTQINHHMGSDHEHSLLEDEWKNNKWIRPAKHEIPCRNYLSEFALTLIFPLVIMIKLVLLLSVILCFHHEGISKRNEDTPDVLMVQYEAVHRATHTLRSLSNQRNSDGTPKESPRLSSERTTGVRPSPPPYMGPKLGSRVDF